MMQVEQLVVGQLAANCYLVWDDKTNEGLIIDPGDDADYIMRRIKDHDIVPKMVVATHGHFDHLLAVTEIRLAYQIPFLMNKKDNFLLRRSVKSAQFWQNLAADPILPPDGDLKDGQIIKVGKASLKVIETPGHTPGSISLYAKEAIFSGDTIFAEGVGRTDLSYSSAGDLEISLKKLAKLPDETIVYPGHGSITTIEDFKEFRVPFDS